MKPASTVTVVDGKLVVKIMVAFTPCKECGDPIVFSGLVDVIRFAKGMTNRVDSPGAV